jgi:hypothetical protein
MSLQGNRGSDVTCQCGCGTPVAPGKQWVRGHNMRAAPGRPASSPPPATSPAGDGWRLTDEAEAAGDAWWEDDGPDDGPLTYEQVASGVPDDPDPARLPTSAAVVTEMRVSRAVQRDIAGKTAFWLLILADTWAIADPYCARALGEAVPGIARKAAPVMCHSPQLVEWFGRASGFMEVTELLMALKPVAVAVVAHHVTKSVQTTRDADGKTTEQEADWSAYTAA